MRVIIAGGRDFVPNVTYLWHVLEVLEDIGATEIFSGGARGADRWGEHVAKAMGLPLRIFPAEWEKYGKIAGFKRNTEMAVHADALIAMPGGRGTLHMIDQAKSKMLEVYIIDPQ